MNVWDSVKQAVTAREAAEYYGLEINRAGMCLCPFHGERTPSMKVDERFHCFGCGADGSVIDLAAGLFGVSALEAAKILARDFGVAYDDKPPDLKQRRIIARKKQDKKMFSEAENKCYRVLKDYYNRLLEYRNDYAPKTPAEPLDKRFCEALQNLDFIGYLLDILIYGDTAEKADLIIKYGKLVKDTEQRIY
ncbi:MAG: DNA primase [Oscillospiraceae bacterium]|nr:DNA primase [Oscillospiraceae bacterium]